MYYNNARRQNRFELYENYRCLSFALRSGKLNATAVSNHVECARLTFCAGFPSLWIEHLIFVTPLKNYSQTTFMPKRP